MKNLKNDDVKVVLKTVDNKHYAVITASDFFMSMFSYNSLIDDVKANSKKNIITTKKFKHKKDLVSFINEGFIDRITYTREYL